MHEVDHSDAGQSIGFGDRIPATTTSPINQAEQSIGFGCLNLADQSINQSIKLSTLKPAIEHLRQLFILIQPFHPFCHSYLFTFCGEFVIYIKQSQLPERCITRLLQLPVPLTESHTCTNQAHCGLKQYSVCKYP